MISILFVVIGGLAYLAGFLFPKNLNFVYGNRPLDEKKRNKLFKYEKEYESYFPAICKIFFCCGISVICTDLYPLRYLGAKYLLMLIGTCAAGSFILYIRIAKTERVWLDVYRSEYVLFLTPTLLIFCFGSIWTVNTLDIKQTQVLYETVTGYYSTTKAGAGVTLTDGSHYNIGYEGREKVKIGDVIEITEYTGVLGLPWDTWSVCSDGTENISEEKNGKVNGESTGDAKKQDFYIGEKIALGNCVFTVNKAEKCEADEFHQPWGGYGYLAVSITIKNKGEGEIKYHPYDFFIVDGKGGTVECSYLTFDDGLNKGGLKPGKLNTKEKISGTMLFEVPKGDMELSLCYRPEFGNNEEVRVWLKEE